MSTTETRVRRSMDRPVATAVVLVLVAVVWILVNGPVEGPVLIVFTKNHGLTVADLPSLAAIGVAALLVWPRSRR